MAAKTTTKKVPLLRQRMYSFVIYQLSGIQAGIQAGHATEQFIEDWNRLPALKARKKDKTVIILNGGTTNQQEVDHLGEPYVGSMDLILEQLCINKVPNSAFYEPDLNNAMTAISFLVDETVWDKAKYPDPEGYNPRARTEADINVNKYWLTQAFGKKTAFLRMFLEKYSLARN